MDAQLHLAVDSVAAFRSSGDGKHPSTVSVALLGTSRRGCHFL